jgi:hypothetical protein
VLVVSAILLLNLDFFLAYVDSMLMANNAFSDNFCNFAPRSILWEIINDMQCATFSIM